MGLLDIFSCKHEFEEIGNYKKLKCKKCNQEIMVKSD
jgi:DNA-directed RNA polymerase subunit RPC12/RpoP